MAHACAALTLNAYYGSTFTRLGNKITPLYIMSKNGGNCSVNLKKKYKKFFRTSIMPHMPHLGITRITMPKPLIYKALRRFCGVITMDSPVSPSINPYATRVCGVFHWNHGKYTEMRKIPMRCAVCAVTMLRNFLTTFPKLVQPIAPPCPRPVYNAMRSLRIPCITPFLTSDYYMLLYVHPIDSMTW